MWCQTAKRYDCCITQQEPKKNDKIKSVILLNRKLKTLNHNIQYITFTVVNAEYRYNFHAINMENIYLYFLKTDFFFWYLLLLDSLSWFSTDVYILMVSFIL